jgi:two-component system cell cycle sensor histidine kinase/response regulator CckA
MTKTEVTDEEFEKTHPDIRPGQYVCLKFKAGGKKLNETATYKRIESFFSAGSKDRNLGVAVAPEIKEALGGRIAIDIYFPESVEKEILPEKLNTGLSDAAETILVVEDEEDEAGITRSVLEKLGYHVLEVKTGMDAINLARTFEGDIDFVFFDVVLPDMGGEELYSLLMETRPNLKAIACSGFATDALVQRLLDAGAQAFIQKPFTVSTVSEKLREILETKL